MEIPIGSLKAGHMAYLDSEGLVEVTGVADYGDWVEVGWDAEHSPAIKNGPQTGLWSAYKSDVPTVFITDLRVP